MPRITIPKYEDMDAEQKALYNEQIAAHGRITNMKQTLLHSKPAFKVLMEWYPLRDKVADFLGVLATNIFAYSISAANECLICSTYFRKILKDGGKDPDKLELDEDTQIISDYGRALVLSPREINNSLFDKLKKKFSQEQIVLLTAFGGMMIATNLINSALEVQPDNYLWDYIKK